MFTPSYPHLCDKICWRCLRCDRKWLSSFPLGPSEAATLPYRSPHALVFMTYYELSYICRWLPCASWSWSSSSSGRSLLLVVTQFVFLHIDPGDLQLQFLILLYSYLLVFLSFTTSLVLIICTTLSKCCLTHTSSRLPAFWLWSTDMLKSWPPWVRLAHLRVLVFKVRSP